MSEPPTLFQKKALWTGVTALSLSVTVAIAIGVVYIVSRVLGFLQPFLVPFAIAGVLAYLLEPAVVWLERRGLTRQRAVLAVFAAFFILFGSITAWIVPQLAGQTVALAKRAPEYALKTRHWALEFVTSIERKYGIEVVPRPSSAQTVRKKADALFREYQAKSRETTSAADAEAAKLMESIKEALDEAARELGGAGVRHEEKARALMAEFAATYLGRKIDFAAAGPDAASQATEALMEEAAAPSDAQSSSQEVGAAREPARETGQEDLLSPALAETLPLDVDWKALLTGEWIKSVIPAVWNLVKHSFGGFLGMFGFVLSMVIVPLYLFYFLIESAHIKRTWSDYLPLRASDFKTEVVDCLNEINGYLIAFFRGQLVVSLINGAATGLGLMIIGLDFGLLIGLMLCVLGIIPYLGIALCYLPALVIAAVQGGSALIPGDPWWALPLAVTVIFIVVQQIDGFFISPKIVGESVGLHPLTVIVSVFVWSLLLGGLLGAILAVPLTASIKVLFQRYVWLARLSPHTVGGARADGAQPAE